MAFRRPNPTTWTVLWIVAAGGLDATQLGSAATFLAEFPDRTWRFSHGRWEVDLTVLETADHGPTPTGTVAGGSYVTWEDAEPWIEARWPGVDHAAFDAIVLLADDADTTTGASGVSRYTRFGFATGGGFSFCRIGSGPDYAIVLANLAVHEVCHQLEYFYGNGVAGFPMPGLDFRGDYRTADGTNCGEIPDDEWNRGWLTGNVYDVASGARMGMLPHVWRAGPPRSGG